MKLSVLERLVLPGLLPKPGTFESDLLNVRALRQLREDLGFDDDGAEIGLKQEGANLVWDADKAKEKEVNIPELLAAAIADNLRALRDNKKINENHLGLWDKFIGADPEVEPEGEPEAEPKDE